MPTYTVKAPNGSTFKLNGSGGPPTEQELEQVYAKIAPSKSSITPIPNELGANQSQSTQSTPSPELSPEQNTQSIEQTIAQRPTAFGANAQYNLKDHPILSTLKALSAPFQVAEAVPADILLAAQRANQGGFNKLGANLSQDIQGNRAPQVGDVYRASGIPVLSSEPVASTLGLTASLGIPGINTGTNMVGGVMSKALSPATDMITSAASRYGKPIVANALSVVTSKPVHIWENLLDNPQWSDKKFVGDLNKSADSAYQAVVSPLEKNTANRIALTNQFKSALHSIGVYVKPQGVDDLTFSRAISGDKAAISAVSNEQNLSKLEALAKDTSLTAEQRNRKLRDLVGTVDEATVSGNPGARGLNIGTLGGSSDSVLEPSAALGRMNSSQQAKIKSWYTSLVSKPDISFNEARRIQSQINSSLESYYKMAADKGSGITGAQASTFDNYATQIKKALVGIIGQQYPEAGKILQQFSQAKTAESVYRATNTFEPHMFRAFLLRMGLSLTGVPGGVAYVAGAAGSIPAVNAKMIGGASKLGGIIARHPASILSPLLRSAGNASQSSQPMS